MNRRPIVLSAAAAALAAGALVTASCGGDDGAASPATAPATTAAATAPVATAPATTAVAVAMGTPKEFSLVPSATSAPAGTVTFTVTNSGKLLHEMVVVPGDAASLKQPDGSASEDGSPGEAPDVEPGAKKTVTITLKPGTYTLLCNIPGHFAGGMYAAFTVN